MPGANSSVSFNSFNLQTTHEEATILQIRTLRLTEVKLLAQGSRASNGEARGSPGCLLQSQAPEPLGAPLPGYIYVLDRLGAGSYVSG